MIVETVRDNGSRRVAVSFPSKDESARSRTKQSFAKECDVNNIMSRYKKTGLLPQLPVGGFYGDFFGVVDFRSTVEKVKSAEQAFMGLPADVRKRFDNDVAAMLSFVADDNNYDEAVRLGIRVKDEAKEAAKAAAIAAERAKLETAPKGPTN